MENNLQNQIRFLEQRLSRLEKSFIGHRHLGTDTLKIRQKDLIS